MFNKLKTLFAISVLALAAFVSAQDIQSYPVTSGNVYTKSRTNLEGRWHQETGYNVTLVTKGDWSLGANVGFVQAYPQLWTVNRWTGAVTLGYKLQDNLTAYTKTNTNFSGDLTQETGFESVLLRRDIFTVQGNFGYVNDWPFSTGDSPQWTAGITVSVPLSRLLK